MKKLIVANWKCNPTNLREAQRMFLALKRGLKNTKADVVVCPPFVYLSSFKFPRTSPARGGTVRGRYVSGFKLGAQDCFWEEKGAFTGEVSPLMLKDLGVKYVIVGHSERRQVLGESDEVVNKKLLAVLKASLTPILCVSETAEEREKGETFSVLENQIKEGLRKVPKYQIGKIIIAYEPVWAIGTKNPCSPDEALTVALFLRKMLAKNFGKKTASGLRILYGGSVDAQNSENYLSTPWLNGFLVGNVSLDVKTFLSIVSNAF